VDTVARHHHVRDDDTDERHDQDRGGDDAYASAQRPG
jgi:hypothetical protein